jgi:hypothetical protein
MSRDHISKTKEKQPAKADDAADGDADNDAKGLMIIKFGP